jgi:hypothetical protein
MILENKTCLSFLSDIIRLNEWIRGHLVLGDLDFFRHYPIYFSLFEPIFTSSNQCIAAASAKTALYCIMVKSLGSPHFTCLLVIAFCICGNASNVLYPEVVATADQIFTAVWQKNSVTMIEFCDSTETPLWDSHAAAVLHNSIAVFYKGCLHQMEFRIWDGPVVLADRGLLADDMDMRSIFRPSIPKSLK